MENVLESKLLENSKNNKFVCPQCNSRSNYYLSGIRAHRCKRCGTIFEKALPNGIKNDFADPVLEPI